MRTGLFRAFQNRNYVRLWLANGLSFNARWMQMTLLSWLILELTDSPWLVALVGFFSSVPMLFLGLLGGVLADSVNRQRLIVLTQGANVGVSLMLTLLLSTGAVQVWHAYLAILVTGAGWALDSPARRGLIFDLLGRSGVTNAMALDSVGMNVSRMLGPALSGVLITLVGVGGGYVVVTLSYALSLLLLGSLRVSQIDRPARRQQHVVRDLVEGFHYVRQDRVIQAVICITVLMNFLVSPYMQMVPVIVRDVLHEGPAMMGILQGAEGFGALLGAVTIASAVRLNYHGRVFSGGSLLALLALLIFSISRWYILSFPTLLVLGLGMAGFGTMQSTIVMLVAKEEIRGRALGIVSLAIGAGPLGSLFLGAIASAISPVFALRLNALLGLILLALVSLLLPSITDRTQPAWQSQMQLRSDGRV